MKKLPIYYSLIFIISILCSNSWAFKQINSHTHGEAVLNIVLENQLLYVEFTSPAMNLTGFEHSPQSDQDKKRVANVRQHLHNAQWLQPTDSAQCQLTKSSAEAHFGEHDQHDDGHATDKHDKNESSEHAEFEASFEYQCQLSEALKMIRLSLLKDYSDLYKIHVNLITETKQTTFTLHDSNTIIHLK